ncbi:MAG: type III-A CRISPR-associated RAMP protein Csm3 [Lachnospiraceae bacterium]|nr:type III-A CRISPR-associated RAMP protein Csm3 [Lachnospiraceae bacterium]
MYGKIQIKGQIELVTGMHIGGSSEFAAIGAVDSPVIRDKATDMPMIPGSSLKGKLRYLLSKIYSGNKIVKDFEEDPEEVHRLFGSSKKNSIHPSRLLFKDMILKNKEELRAQGVQSPTEVKFENSINRATAVANPRQIERVIRGSKFDLDIIYNMENEAEALEDFEALKEGLKMLRYDYLGGHGSRGYGKVELSGITAAAVAGKVDAGLVEKINAILKEV